MSEMVERVAKAMACLWLPEEVARRKEVARQLEPIARAAIAAMREPTEAMVKAARNPIVRPMPHITEIVRAEWKAMIDAALE